MLKKTAYAAAFSALIGVGLLGTFPAFAQEPTTDRTTNHMADTMMGREHQAMMTDHSTMMGVNHDSMTNEDHDAMASMMHVTMEPDGRSMNRPGR